MSACGKDLCTTVAGVTVPRAHTEESIAVGVVCASLCVEASEKSVITDRLKWCKNH